tara:strand:- start:217 stop:417 length:201 start_codon:yes stop_codon:yes gene_type:complete
MLESLILGAILNIWTVQNIDFFHAKAHAEKTMNCEWVNIEARPPQDPAITVFGKVYFKQKCVKNDD